MRISVDECENERNRKSGEGGYEGNVIVERKVKQKIRLQNVK